MMNINVWGPAAICLTGMIVSGLIAMKPGRRLSVRGMAPAATWMLLSFAAATGTRWLFLTHQGL